MRWYNTNKSTLRRARAHNYGASFASPVVYNLEAGLDKYYAILA